MGQDQLSDILDHLSLMSYEVVLMMGALIVLVGGLVTKKTLIARVLFVATLLATLLASVVRQEPEMIFYDALILDALGDIFKLLFSGLAIWIVFFPGAQKRNSEFYFLILAMMVGSVFMLSASNLLIIYLAVELTSFASYILTNFNFSRKGFEAGIKYLLFGGVSSAIALYGASLVYGISGSLTLSEMNTGGLSGNPLFNFGLLTFVGGLFFKASLVPFHIWTPSTYQEAPTEAVAILSTVPKIGAFVLLHRIFDVFDLQDFDWLRLIVMVVGIATIALGTLGALQQNNHKRLIAYGAIAHSGFLLAPLLIPGHSGLNAFTYYSIIYGVMNLAVFYLLDLYESKGISTLEDMTGLGRKESYLGGLLVLVLIALIGLPPTAGFTAKISLFSAMWEWFQMTVDPMLAIFFGTAVISVVFSLFFYLRIPYYYFFKETEELPTIKSDFVQRFLATIFTGVLLWIFFTPQILNNIAESIKFIAW